VHHLLTIRVADTNREIISARLWALGTVGVHDLGDHLEAAFVDRGSAVEAASSLGTEPVIESVPDDEGLDTWKQFARWVEAGPFVICPTWITPPEGHDVILIDPGRSFGSGSHPSTRLAIEVLAEVLQPGMSVLDVGCGSGVLSIAAARMGASVTAVDTDPAAVEATRINVAADHIGKAVRVIPGSAVDLDRRFDLIVVNVTIDIQESLATAITDRLTPDGTLVAAGILVGSQEDRISRSHPEMDLIARATEQEWVVLGMRRRGRQG